MNFRLFLLMFVWIFSNPVHAIEARSSSENSLFTKADTEVLTPDQAFKLEIKAQDQRILKANFTIAQGHYLYRDKIKFEAKGLAIESTLPQGDIKKDTHFGEVEVYHNGLIATIVVNNPTNNQSVHIEATYQGCSEKGLCYSPTHKTFQIDLPSGSADDQATTLLKSGKLWLIVIGFFGFGVLLALTPCVLPMIPILSGIIVGDKKVHHHATSRLHAFNLSLAYTLGMSLSYTLAGIAAGLSGQPEAAGEHAARIHSVRQGPAGADQLWLGRQRGQQPPGARNAQKRHGHFHGAHSVSWKCARFHRPDGRAGAVHGRKHSAGGPVPQAGQGAGVGGDQPGAQPGPARRAHGHRVGGAQLRSGGFLRLSGACRHPQRGRGPAQRGVQGRLEPAGHQEPHGGAGGRPCLPRCGRLCPLPAG